MSDHSRSSGLLDHILTAPQYIAPQRGLSNLARRLAGCKNPTIKNFFIRAFCSRYVVDLRDAECSRAIDYESFNGFFTRRLKTGARPLAQGNDAILSPADGSVSQIGEIQGDSIFQAKGREYSLAALLGGEVDQRDRFAGGSFATVYLAPFNYHRVHVPLDGTVISVRYIPGRLFSVNNRTARCVDKLFSRNERLVVELEVDGGRMILVLVGAMLVSSMALVCCDIEAALNAQPHRAEPFSIEIESNASRFARGSELGRFNMGSTVIIIVPENSCTWDRTLAHGTTVRVGQALGTWSMDGSSVTAP